MFSALRTNITKHYFTTTIIHSNNKMLGNSPIQTAASATCQVLQNNKEFVADVQKKNPIYFSKLAQGQSPKILWIGCSDSRVGVDMLAKTEPGDIFIHRNIANRIPSEDMNALTVLEFAVRHLKVSHVVVAGHTGCGGVKEAMSNGSIGILDHWLRPIKDLYVANEKELLALPEDKRADRLAEFNVIEGVNTVSKLPVVQDAWKEGRKLEVHGWMVELHTGLLRDLEISMAGPQKVQDIYKFK